MTLLLGIRQSSKSCDLLLLKGKEKLTPSNERRVKSTDLKRKKYVIEKIYLS